MALPAREHGWDMTGVHPDWTVYFGSYSDQSVLVSDHFSNNAHYLALPEYSNDMYHFCLMRADEVGVVGVIIPIL